MSSRNRLSHELGASHCRALKWRGLIAEMPDRQTVLRALESEDLFLFAGHGSMSTIVGASRVRQPSLLLTIRVCALQLAQQTVHAVTVLMGCASTSIRQSEQHSLLEARSTSDEYALAQWWALLTFCVGGSSTLAVRRWSAAAGRLQIARSTD